MKKYYIAYGSNLNKKHFFNLALGSSFVSTTILKNKRLVFKGRGPNYSYLTIEENVGSEVPVVVYEISDLDEVKLDYYEGYPNLYEKKKIPILINGQEIEALIYIMVNNERFTYNKPSDNYLITCLRGYSDYSFDTDILFKALDDTNSLNNKKFFDGVVKKIVKKIFPRS